MPQEVIYYMIYGIIIWITGFLGGMGVLLYDYRGYGRDVKIGEFIRDTLLTLILWPGIIHHIFIYTFRALFNLFGIDTDKLKDITIVKGSKK